MPPPPLLLQRRQACIHALAQLAALSCPVAELVLQQWLAKVLAHLKKHLQDADSLVRDASCEALAAYAAALAEACGGPLPGSSHASPVVRVLFECLAEQKREGHLGASQALLMVSTRGTCAAVHGARRRAVHAVRLAAPAACSSSERCACQASAGVTVTDTPHACVRRSLRCWARWTGIT